ncbi:DUF4179 domain-containing protein [Halalkalibacter alkaliphilus]|uniref:DUF4179 domain-containing protein n=1 Tax=Halalkalibacter alkaliphilus TaxID=2917993 RepID=A0A9X2I637_9BACI|nr:DUF4179 domain-containing protein [Halalkalibacter alkaliphilus]MCL7748672.1 DUF4179 domain-containing protein [Halalkalibacter alkaliphilus]
MSCKYCESHLIDYIDNKLDAKELKQMEEHLNKSDDCRSEYHAILQVTSSLARESQHINVPADLMEGVREKGKRTKRKRFSFYRPGAWAAAIVLSFLFISTAVATNGFNDVLDWWKHITEVQQQRVDQNINHGLGERVNMEELSNNVKVTITDVVADDLQTHIYYEIEDLSREQHYMLDYFGGTKIRSANENWKDDHYQENELRSHMRLYSEQDYVVKGRIGITPLAVEEGTISLQLSELEKVPSLFEEGKSQEIVPIEERELYAGDWEFDIPIKKHSAIVKDLNVETEIDGKSVTFSKLTIAPTVTTLQYQFNNSGRDEQILQYRIKGIIGDGVLYEPDNFSVGGAGSTSYGPSYVEVGFESMYLSQPDVIQIMIEGSHVEVNDNKHFIFDFDQNETFEYLDTTITIEDIELGNPTTFELKEEFQPNREYESLFISYLNDNNQPGFASSSNGTGFIMDAAGKVYDLEEYFFRIKELDQPRFFTTGSSVTVYGDDDVEIVKPTGFEINGYTKTKFFDQVVEIDLR